MARRERKDPDGWTIHEIWDPETRTRTNRYYFKRKPALRVELGSKMAKQLAGYTLIEKDLRSVLVWLQKISKLKPEADRSEGMVVGSDRAVLDVIKGLYVASLTFYGKCFTQCEGRRVKLDKSLLDSTFQPAHDEVMHMRHNFAAHSGADNFEEVRIALVLHPKKKSEDVPRIYRELQQPDLAEGLEGDIEFAQLVEHVHDKVWKKIHQVEGAIYEREILPKGRDYWYRRGKRG